MIYCIVLAKWLCWRTDPEDDIACAIVCDAVTEIALSARCVLNIRLSGGAASYMIALYMYTSWFFELAMREESLVSFRR
ncbi:hypothetical protein ACFX12_012381 [Malus domestica]